MLFGLVITAFSIFNSQNTEVLLMEENEIKEVSGTAKVEEKKFILDGIKLLITDPSQITGLVMLPAGFVEHPEADGYKELSLKDFKGRFDEKGKLTHYFVEDHKDTLYLKEYFDNWKRFEKIFGQDTKFLFMPKRPLIMALQDCETSEGAGILCYCVAPRVEG